MTRAVHPGGIRWLTDLVHLEIVLWDQIDVRLRERHGLPLGSFLLLNILGRAPEAGLRVGELAQAMRITVGGASKVVDRMERGGLIRRMPDGEDRRASRVVLTSDGAAKLADASPTCEAAMADVLDSALDPDEQRQFHGLVQRVLAALERPDSGRSVPQSGRSPLMGNPSVVD